MVLSSNSDSFKTSIFGYLKVTVIIDAINLIITSGSSLTLSQSFKSYYWIQFYYLYVVLYFSKVLQTTNSFVKIKLSADRVAYLRKRSKDLILLDRSRNKKVKIHVFVFFVFAAVLQSPSLIAYEVRFSNGTSKIQLRDFIKNNPALMHILEYTIPIVNLIIMLDICIRMYKVLYFYSQYDLKESIELKKITKTTSKKVINDVDDNEKLVIKVEDEFEAFDEKTNILVLWFIILFIVNQAVSLGGSIFSLINNELQHADLFNSSVYMASLTIYLTSCCINVLLFKTYNRAFGLQLKRLCGSKYN